MKAKCRSRTVCFSLALLLAIAVALFPCLSYAAEEQTPSLVKRDFFEVMAQVQRVKQEVLERGYSFSVGYNPAADYTIEQLCGLKPPPPQAQESAYVIQAPVIGALPTAYDWRDLNGVTPIKNQLYCGSCWAFATVVALEHQIRIQCGATVDLSEQYLVSCNQEGYGCGGGSWAHDYHQSPGAVPESEFPYQAQDLPCGGPYSHPYQIDWWGSLGWYSTPSAASIKQAIYDYGSVAAAVCVGEKFNYYTGGIFEADESTSCGSSRVNHGIALVGWNDDRGVDDGYWILKNSWGTGWGENGYMRIRYNKSNVGLGASYVAFSGCETPISTGSLQVTLSPQEAVAAGAQWQVDGGTWMNSGAVVTGLAAGSHTVSFKDVAGWSKPANRSVTIQSGLTTTASATYTQQSGSLSVSISPAGALAAGAQWQVDGGAWINSGATVAGLAAGSHTVAFKDVAGWNKPADRTVSITSGATTYATAAYVQQTGNLYVTLSPQEAVAAGAQWQVDGGTWKNSGALVTGLTVGSHTLAFKDVTGWNKPANQTVTITNATTTSINGVYKVPSGSLNVTIAPSAVAQLLGAQWRVDGGAWKGSGAIASDLKLGSHLVEFSDVAGWNKPANLTATIYNGQTTSLSGSYSAKTGSAVLTVTIVAQQEGVTKTRTELVASNAQWRVDGGEWHSGGEIASGLSLGLHWLEFAPVPGWRTPSTQILQITTSTNSAAGTYTPAISMPWLSILLED